MKVLVDASIWSLALRRRREQLSPGDARLVRAWSDLVADGCVVLVGIIRQEVLSGVSDARTFIQLRELLAPFPDEPLHSADHLRAAEMFNLCRGHDIQCASIDILLCAAAERLAVPIFTTDNDFERYGRLVPVELFRPRAQG